MATRRASTTSCANSPCLLLLVLLGAGCTNPSPEQIARQREAAEQAAAAQARAQQERAETARDMKVYATQFLPDLERDLNALTGEVASREDALQRYAQDLAALNRNPGRDPEYQARQKELARIKATVAQLEKEREDAFLAYRAFQRFPEKKNAATAREHDRLVARAKRESADARNLIEALRKSPPGGSAAAEMPTAGRLASELPHSTTVGDGVSPTSQALEQSKAPKTSKPAESSKPAEPSRPAESSKPAETPHSDHVASAPRQDPVAREAPPQTPLPQSPLFKR